jgi:hypothetical protein
MVNQDVRVRVDARDRHPDVLVQLVHLLRRDGGLQKLLSNDAHEQKVSKRNLRSPVRSLSKRKKKVEGFVPWRGSSSQPRESLRTLSAPRPRVELARFTTSFRSQNTS